VKIVLQQFNAKDYVQQCKHPVFTTSINYYLFSHSTTKTKHFNVYTYKSKYMILKALIAPQNARKAAVEHTAVVV
jgi:hypothetical protein